MPLNNNQYHRLQQLQSQAPSQASNPYHYGNSPSSKHTQCFIVELRDDGELDFGGGNHHSTEKENTIEYRNNKLVYYYNDTEEEITEELKESLVKILYHKINSALKREEDKIKEKKSKMKGFSKWLRLDKLKRILGDDEV